MTDENEPNQSPGAAAGHLQEESLLRSRETLCGRWSDKQKLRVWGLAEPTEEATNYTFVK